MPQPQTAPLVSFGLPVGGINARDPLTTMDPLYSPWINNFDVENQSIKLRNGYQVWATDFDESGGGLEVLCQIGKYQLDSVSSSIFAVTYLASSSKLYLYNITTGTPSFVQTGAAGSALDIRVLNFNKRLAFVNDSSSTDGGLIYDGSTWTDWNFTTGGNYICSLVCASYKGRVYICDGTNIYYSALDAVSGATTTFSVEHIMESGSPIYWIARLASPSNAANESLLAFGNAAGDVRVYAGDNPAAANWEIVGYFKIPDVSSCMSVLEYQNDVWISTTSGIVSLRNLFRLGSDSDEIYVTKMIEPFWKRLQRAHQGVIDISPTFTTAQHVSLTYLPYANKVVARMSQQLTDRDTVSNTGATHFIYNGSTGAWSMHTLGAEATAKNFDVPQSGLAGLTGIMYVSDESVMWYNPSAYKDEDDDDEDTFVSYSAELDSAYQSFGSFHKYKKIKSIEPIYNLGFDDDANTISIKVAADFGKKVSGSCQIPLLTGYQFPVYNVGVEGLFLQYRILVTQDLTDNGSFEIFSVGGSVI